MLVNKDTGEVTEIMERNIDGYELTANAIDTIYSIESEMKHLKNVYEMYKKALLESMEKYGLTKIETPYFTVTYVDPHTSVKFDSKRFKKEHPDIAEEYENVSEVRGSVRVRLK